MQLIGVIARKGLYYLRLTTAQRMKKQGTEFYTEDQLGGYCQMMLLNIFGMSMRIEGGSHIFC